MPREDHVERLVEGCPFWTSDHRDDAVQVAWLHRSLTDGEKAARDLKHECFSRIVIDDVEALSRDYAANHGAWTEDTARDAHLAAVLVMLAELEVSRKSVQGNNKVERADFEIEARRADIRTMLINAARLKGWDDDAKLMILQQ